MRSSMAALLVAALVSPVFCADEPKEGWHFQVKTTPEEEINPENENEKSLLLKILAEQKKQTQLQEKILQVLQKAFDPQPEYIVGDDGKQCVANSSSKCFKMPVTADALRIPVLRAYVENPTIETATEYKKWEARFLNVAFDAGIAGTLAIQKGGIETYPINYKTSDHTSAYGEESREKDKVKAELVGEKGRYIVFLGRNIDIDLISVVSIAQLAKRVGGDKIDIVYANKKIETLFDESAKAIYATRSAWKTIASKEINPVLFDEYKIYTTPQIVYEYDDPKAAGKQKSLIVASGDSAAHVVIGRTIEALALDGVLNRSEMAQYKIDETHANEAPRSKDIFERRYDITLQPEKIKDKE